MIQCTHVYKRYKNGTNALYDINLLVDQGEFVYVIGPTGSGKSTLIKLMDAEEMCTKGNVKVVGMMLVNYPNVRFLSIAVISVLYSRIINYCHI